MKIWLQKYTYRVEKDHTLIHDFQKVGHEIEIVVEFLDQFSNFWCFDFDDKGIR